MLTKNNSQTVNKTAPDAKLERGKPANLRDFVNLSYYIRLR